MIRRQCLKSIIIQKRFNHSARLALLDQGLDVEPGAYTYPPNSNIINGRHFYQNTVLMDWVRKEPKPISLRQLAFFGRKLTADKLISSANFVRLELPTRIAHRIRDMQVLPFACVSNPYLCHVYEQYYHAFNKFRKFPKIQTLQDNDKFCELLNELLDEHLSVIPSLVMGAIENSMANTLESDRLDNFMNQMLRSRISRRVIAEQHLALSHSFQNGKTNYTMDYESYIGEVFLQCDAKQAVEQCAQKAKALVQEVYPDVKMPDIEVEGHTGAAKFPYIKSHLDYIIGEILRNSVEATVSAHAEYKIHRKPPPIVVSISNTPQNVMIRISDQGGGIPENLLPHLWSFARGPKSTTRLDNFKRVPEFAGLSSEVKTFRERKNNETVGSLSGLSSRPPELKLGMGLPLSRVYAEYWDGALDLQSLEGYGCDVFLRISRLGNQSEKLQLDGV